MAPVGSYEALNAAIAAGADSVYFGVEQLNMRAASSVNFTLDDLAEIVKTAHAAGVKTYLTVNIVIYDTEMEVMRTIIDRAKAEGIEEEYHIRSCIHQEVEHIFAGSIGSILRLHHTVYSHTSLTCAIILFKSICKSVSHTFIESIRVWIFILKIYYRNDLACKIQSGSGRITHLDMYGVPARAAGYCCQDHKGKQDKGVSHI